MMGTSQFLSVPYALHANTVENADDADADPTNESITSVELTNDIMTIAESGQSFEVDLSEYSDDGDWLLTDDDVTNTTHNIGVGTDNPTSTLSVEGSIAHNVNYISITDDVIMPLGDGDHTVIVELDGGNMEIILPNPSNCPGREYIIKAFADSGVNTVNISCNTHDIDGYDSIDLSGTFRESAHLISAGDNGWWIIN